MWQIVIRIKRNDNTGKKRTFQVILDFLKKNKVSGLQFGQELTATEKDKMPYLISH